MKEQKDRKVVEVLINSDEDVILARQKVRSIAKELGFNLLDQTRIVTAISELGRNIVVHAKEGKMSVFKAESEIKKGLIAVFEDKGPGIPDIEKAMVEGFSTVGSLGLGLKGAKKLVDEFEIESGRGQGTTISITKWL